MTTVRQSASGSHDRSQDQHRPGLNELVANGCRLLLALLALEWSKRQHRPNLRAQREPAAAAALPGRHRWQAIFPALPRPGPANAPLHQLPSARQVIA
jgi:hypothetical protein